MKRILPLLLIVLAACAQQEQRASEQTTTHTGPEPTTAATGGPSAPVHEQTIQVGSAFTPASVTIPANRPVRLHFRRTGEATCAEEIVIPGLNMRKKIAANETVTFDLPAQHARTLDFACGMDMMKGTVVVQ